MFSKDNKKSSLGFTMIELLVVIAIIGLLAAIALSEFALYKRRAADSAARTDLRSMLTAQEAYYIDNEQYSSALANLPNFTTSAQVNLTVTSGDVNGWSGNSYHDRGGQTFCYSSTGSGEIEVVDGLAAACP